MYRLSLVFVLLLFSTVSAVGAESRGIGDLLQDAWRAERQGNYTAALAAYSSALALRPDDPQLNLKVAELLPSDKQAAVAACLVKALDGLQKDPKCPLDLKIGVCSALMGSPPREWRGGGWAGRASSSPWSTLPEAEQKRLAKAFPESWFFPSKTDELHFRLSVGETDRALKLAKEVVASGSWRVPLFDNFTPTIPEASHKQLAKAWSEEGRTSGNLSLRLGALALYARLKDMRSFKQDYPEILQAANGQFDLLKPLADLCSAIGWVEEAQRVTELRSAQTDSAETKDLKLLEKLIKAGDRARASEKLRQILVDYPDAYYYALDIDNLAEMVGHGWGDLLAEFISPEMLEDLQSRDIRTNVIIVASCLFNQPRLDYWVKNMVGRYAKDDAFCSSMAVHTHTWPAEDRVWLFEQFGRMFPTSDDARSGLSEAYIEAGYPNRAFPILQQLIRTRSADRVGGWASSLLKVASGVGKLPEVTDAIWNDRESLLPQVQVGVARYFLAEKDAEAARKWLSDLYSRVSIASNPEAAKGPGGLWQSEVYVLRLDVLGKLGRKDEAKVLLAEAQRRYPDYVFVERLPWLSNVVEVNPNDEVSRLCAALSKLDSPSNSRVPCQDLIKLAYALLKAGKSAEAGSVATKALPVHNQWQRGLPLAVAMVKEGAKAVVPFVDWLLSVLPQKQQYSSQNPVDDTYWYLQNKDQALARAFAVAAALCVPESFGQSSVMYDAGYGQNVQGLDLKPLVPALASRKLNRRTMSAIADRYGNGGNSPADWAMELVASQTWSASGLILNLYALAPTGPAQQVRELINALSAEQDWVEADVRLLSWAASRLSSRGMSAESERLLAIGLKHASDYDRTYLASAAVSSTGKPPSGAYAADATAWASYAAACRNNKRLDEARSAITRGLQLAKTPGEKFNVFGVLVTVDPDAVSKIAAHFSSFTQGKREHMRDVAELAFGLAKKDHRLAAKVAPILQMASGCNDYNYNDSCWPDVAAVQVWAGHTDRAISTMLARLGDDSGLERAILFLCTTEMDTDPRNTIARALDAKLASSGVELSYLADSMRNARLFAEGTADGLACLAWIMSRRVQGADGVVPSKFLDACIRGLCTVARRSKPSEQLTRAWYQMTEVAIRKAAQSPDDAKTVSAWLRQSVEQMQSNGMKDTDTLQRLSALAKALR